MHEVEYVLVDVFARRGYEGNMLAVVLDADSLSVRQMQQIACELNLSETTFVVTRSQADIEAGADYHVRIFTASTELPFAGHPTLGTAWVLADEGRLETGSRLQACGAGLIGVQIDPPDADRTGGLVELRAVPRDHAMELSDSATLGCLRSVGLHADDLDGSAVIAGCGLSFAYLPVRDDALARAHVRYEPMSALDLGRHEPTDPLVGLAVFSVAPAPEQLDVHARVFVPGPSVPEDPATGSAAAGLGVALVATGVAAPDGVTGYEIRQGEEMDRPSFLRGRVEASGGLAETCWVAGRVVPVGRGRLRVPDER